MFITAGIAVMAQYTTMVSTSIPYRVRDDARRLRDWEPAMTAVGTDREVIDWVRLHQGPMDLPYHGVEVTTRYRDGAWEITFIRSWSATHDSRGRATAPDVDLVVTADGTGSGRVIERHEVPAVPVLE